MLREPASPVSAARRAKRKRRGESRGHGRPSRTSGDEGTGDPEALAEPERHPPRMASKADVGHKDVAVLCEAGDDGAAAGVVEANLAAAEERAA